jgi:hypothetical protein
MMTKTAAVDLDQALHAEEEVEEGESTLVDLLLAVYPSLFSS